MDLRILQKLQAFFKAFQESGFKPDIKQIPSHTTMRFAQGPVNILVNKTEAIQLLRNNFATFKGDAFKDDNAILKWLSNPANRNSFISKLTKGERDSLQEYLQFKEYMLETGTAGQQTAVAGGQEATTQEQTAQQTGAGLPLSMAGSSAATSRPRIIHTVPKTAVPEEVGSKLFVADKSGKIVEERTVISGGTTVEKVGQPSSIAIANKSGVVVGEYPLGEESIKGTAPKLAVANKGGVVNEGFRGEKVLAMANKGGQVVGEKLVKGLESEANIGIKKGLTSVGRGLGEMAKGLGKGLAGLAQGTLGGMAGGGGMLVRRVGLPVADRLPLFSNQLSRGGIKPPGGKKALFLLLGMFLLLIFASAFARPTNPPGLGNVGIGTGGAVNSCTFTQAGSNIKVPIKSQLLASIFNEVATKTGVPAAMLAAIGMHEAQDFVTNADDNHDAFSNKNFTGVDCLPHFVTSSAGALGLMQVVPPSSVLPSADQNSFSLDGVSWGAAFLGKTLDTLTREDFCDIRSNIYLAAGVIIAKNGGRPPSTSNEVKTAACGYYGACSVGSYDYAEEVRKDYDSCSATFVAKASCPIPNGKIICGSYGNPTPYGGFDNATCSADSSGIGGHCGPNYQSVYPNLCSPLTSSNNLLRTAKSIDIESPGGSQPGDPVYLPTVNGQGLNWFYKGLVNAGGSFGWIRIFQSENTTDGVYTLHLVHVNDDNPNLQVNQELKSGDLAATLYPQTLTHLHITIGRNVGDDVFANNLQAYSPGWLSADRDLGICAGQ